MSLSRILVVEDEPDIASVLVDYLRASGFEAQSCGHGGQALAAIAAEPPSLVLLDLMLPGIDGLEILKQVRSRGTLPVILLTARVEELDRLLGLELGADDYICKPFSPREVVARVKAVLRRTRSPAPDATPQSGALLDAERQSVTIDGVRIDLTRREYMLLDALARRPGRVFPRRQLMDHVYAGDLEASERALDSHVKNLRRKLASADAQHEWIRAVYGVGFSFEPR